MRFISEYLMKFSFKQLILWSFANLANFEKQGVELFFFIKKKTRPFLVRNWQLTRSKLITDWKKMIKNIKLKVSRWC